jgi:hypothetical protein
MMEPLPKELRYSGHFNIIYIYMLFNAALSTFEVMEVRIKCGNHYVRELTRMLRDRARSKAFLCLTY